MCGCFLYPHWDPAHNWGCASTGNWTGWPFGSQARAQSTELYQPQLQLILNSQPATILWCCHTLLLILYLFCYGFFRLCHRTGGWTLPHFLNSVKSLWKKHELLQSYETLWKFKDKYLRFLTKSKGDWRNLTFNTHLIISLWTSR